MSERIGDATKNGGKQEMSDTATLSRSAPAAQPPVEVLWLPARQMDGQRHSLNGPLLVDGSDGDVLDGPLRLAQLLARRDRVRVQVLAVVSPLSSERSIGVSLAAGLDSEEVDECRREVARNRTRARVSEHVGLSVFFGTSSALGPRVDTLSEAARSDAAAYVLSGLPALGTSGREAGGRLASRLAVEAATPVLAVPPNVHALPRSVLAAVDGGDASMDAARAALPLLGEFGSLTLLHVVPSDSLEGGRSPVAERQHRVMDALRSLAKELRGSADVAVHLVTLQGDPQAVLAEWVSGFDLVTLGASSHETIEPASDASTSRIVFETAPGVILVAPARSAGKEAC
ncbi:MAG TPA: universal stress protein [Gemmatimonadales bacterium]